MSHADCHVCPVSLAHFLDTRLRRLVQNPERLLAPYVRAGMEVLDFGCGPGFFSVPMARMVGSAGRVIACDVQSGMLDKVQAKIRGTELESRVRTHLCTESDVGIHDRIDFVLAFYVVHEVPDPGRLLKQLREILKADGNLLVVEPPIHVSRAAFGRFLDLARATGFAVLPGPRLRFSKTAILQRSDA